MLDWDDFEQLNANDIVFSFWIARPNLLPVASCAIIKIAFTALLSMCDDQLIFAPNM